MKQIKTKWLNTNSPIELIITDSAKPNLYPKDKPIKNKLQIIANEDYKIIQKSKDIPISNNTDNSTINNIRKYFNENIIGYDAIKEFIILAVKAKMRSANNKTHILLSGSPSTSKTVFLDNLLEAIGEDYFLLFNGASLSKSGLIDFLASQDLTKIKYIGIDEIDKIERDQQTILLTGLESGYLKETKFKRNRTLDVNHILWFGTSNDIEKIIDPLKTRFRCINMPKYDTATLKSIAKTIIKRKYNFSDKIAEQIINECIKSIKDVTIRDIVAITSMIENPDKDIKTITQVYDKHSFNFGNI